MIEYLSQELSPKEQYKLLSSSIVPRPIAWISTLNQQTKVLNLAPFSFVSGASNQEPLLSLAIFRENDMLKDTARNLLNEGEGVIHVVEEMFLEQMNMTSKRLFSEESELSLIDMALVDSQTVATPGLKDARIRLEVRVKQHIPIYADGTETVMTDLFILKITAFHFDEEIFDEVNKYIKLEELKTVGRLSGPHYAINLNQIIQLERPK